MESMEERGRSSGCALFYLSSCCLPPRQHSGAYSTSASRHTPRSVHASGVMPLVGSGMDRMR